MIVKGIFNGNVWLVNGTFFRLFSNCLNKNNLKNSSTRMYFESKNGQNPQNKIYSLRKRC